MWVVLLCPALLFLWFCIFFRGAPSATPRKARREDKLVLSTQSWPTPAAVGQCMAGGPQPAALPCGTVLIACSACISSCVRVRGDVVFLFRVPGFWPVSDFGGPLA